MHNQGKNQSVQTDKEMTSARELVDKDIKMTILNIFDVFEEKTSKIERNGRIKKRPKSNFYT